MDGDSIQYLPKNMQAGLTLLDTKNGEIRAIGGGRDRKAGDFNYAVDTKRQPGSTIKPILDYGPVIENKKWSTYEQIEDEAYTYSNGDPINNFDRSYRGWISMREALVESRNIPALKAFQEAGKDNIVKFAGNLGLNINSDDLVKLMQSAALEMVCRLCKWPERIAPSATMATTMSRILLPRWNSMTALSLT